MIMETGIIKELIQKAEKSVEDMGDEKLKLKAFEVVLNNLMKSSNEEKANSYSKLPGFSELPKSGELINKQINKLSEDNLLNKLNISNTQLNSIIDFDGDDFRILPRIQGNSEAEKQKKASLIIITIKYYCYGSKEINTVELKNKLQDMGIKSLNNMATHLKDYENYMVKKGKQGSPETSYRITDPGLNEGLKLIKELGEHYE